MRIVFSLGLPFLRDFMQNICILDMNCHQKSKVNIVLSALQIVKVGKDLQDHAYRYILLLAACIPSGSQKQYLYRCCILLLYYCFWVRMFT